MQNQEQEKSIQEMLKEKLEILAKITPKSLARTNELGTSLDFSKGFEIFKRTLKLYRDLKDANLDGFPDQILQNLLTFTDVTINNFESIKDFQPAGQTNPVGVRDSLIQQVETQYVNQFSSIYPILAYSFGKGTDFDSLVGEAKTSVSRVEEEAKKVEAARKEIEDTLKQARKAAAEVGVAKHAVIFKSEADSHKIKGRYWLGATVVLAAITVAFGFWSVSYYIDKIMSLSTAQAVQVGLSKLVILGVLYFGLVWAGKIYKAQQHNYVVNQHRHNALNTFETFVKATEDEQTKNAVLIQATQSIFSPQHSGFTAQEKELSTSPQVLEIFRSFMGGER